MPKAAKVGDNAHNPADSHGKPCCPHGVTGPAIAGSPDVFVNSKNSLRIGDPGVHSACCGANTWNCAAGSSTVFINGIAAVRIGDMTAHCGGSGKMVTGSNDVFIGG